MTEASALGEGARFSLGGHTTNHVALPVHSRREQQQEIETNKALIETLGNRATVCFAYPYGDHAAETVQVVQECGFELAVTTRKSRVESQSHPLRLPRFAVTDCDGEEFSCRLREMFSWG